VDLLVNNAGVWRAFEINVRGGFLCAHAVLPAMTARGRGRIVNIASHAGAYAGPGRPPTRCRRRPGSS
jgi:3-oxoacyl-[acyl-carrier protein] reductase